ncbi:MAG: hypothetical protein IKC34_03080 [Clostridia bacterium]|nr:hypothetical protein [Clostridia bacterium]
MNKALGLKASPLLILCRLLAVLLILGCLACGCVSRIDFRTEEQKEADYRESLISSSAFQKGVKGIIAAKKNKIFPTMMTKVTVFSSANLVLITYTHAGITEQFCYNTKTKRPSTKEHFKSLLGQKEAAYMANQFYAGNTNAQPPKYTVDYTDKDLQIMIEEAKG